MPPSVTSVTLLLAASSTKTWQESMAARKEDTLVNVLERSNEGQVEFKLATQDRLAMMKSMSDISESINDMSKITEQVKTTQTLKSDVNSKLKGLSKNKWSLISPKAKERQCSRKLKF